MVLKAESPGGSEELYQMIFENLPFVAFTLDREGRLLEANREAEQVFGLRIEDVRGKKFSELGMLGKKDLLKAFLEFRKNLRGKVTKKTVYKVRLKGGREILLELIGIPLKEKGKVTKVLDVGNDITESRKVKAEIIDSEERLKVMFEYAPDAYYMNDLKGNFIDGNMVAEKLTGYRKDELIGKNMAKVGLLPLEQIPKALANLAKNALGKPTGPDEFTLIRKNGSRVEVEISTYPVKIKGKTVVLGIAREITGRKKREEELKRRTSELERFSRLSVGRELKMVELKKRIKELERKLKEKSK